MQLVTTSIQVFTTMAELIAYDETMLERISAFWCKVFPEWPEAGDSEQTRQIVTKPENLDVSLLCQNGELIATAISMRQIAPDGSSNIWISVASEPAQLSAADLKLLLSRISGLDAELPNTWHIISLQERLPEPLELALAEEGFLLDRMTREMEWCGDAVPLADPGNLRIQEYDGGDAAIDQAILDLHNRSYRALRLVSQMSPQNVWRPYFGQKSRGMVICWDGDSMASFAEWGVLDDKPIVTSIVAARSHWGTSAAAAAGTRAMQHLLDMGYRRLLTYASTRNTAAYKLHLRYGWREVKVVSPVYIRKL